MSTAIVVQIAQGRKDINSLFRTSIPRRFILRCAVERPIGSFGAIISAGLAPRPRVIDMNRPEFFGDSVS